MTKINSKCKKILLADIVSIEWNLLEGLEHDQDFTYMHWKSLSSKIQKYAWSVLLELGILLFSLNTALPPQSGSFQ